MLSKEDVYELFNEWLAKIEEGVKQKNGNLLCESTRMALAFALILHAYFPDIMTCEISEQMKSSFAEALECIKEQRRNDIDPDGCIDLYERNVCDRLKEFDRLSQTWWGVGIQQK